jgi:hypothetical protein
MNIINTKTYTRDPKKRMQNVKKMQGYLSETMAQDILKWLKTY